MKVEETEALGDMPEADGDEPEARGCELEGKVGRGKGGCCRLGGKNSESYCYCSFIQAKSFYKKDFMNARRIWLEPKFTRLRSNQRNGRAKNCCWSATNNSKEKVECGCVGMVLSRGGA